MSFPLTFANMGNILVFLVLRFRMQMGDFTIPFLPRLDGLLFYIFGYILNGTFHNIISSPASSHLYLYVKRTLSKRLFEQLTFCQNHRKFMQDKNCEMTEHSFKKLSLQNEQFSQVKKKENQMNNFKQKFFLPLIYVGKRHISLF